MSEKEQPQGNASWEAATVDSSVVKRLNEYEQGFRKERAEARARRESKAEIEEWVTVTDVTNPSRVLPRERPQYEQPKTEAVEVDKEISREARLQKIRGQLDAPLEHEAKPSGSGSRLDEIKQQLSKGNELER